MCGIPHHAARGYLQRLTDLGHRVAICEQLEDPSMVKGIVKRGVVRVVTPGVILDEESLDARVPNYVAAVAGEARRGFGLAFIDVTTGDFRATQAASTEALAGRDRAGRAARDAGAARRSQPGGGVAAVLPAPGADADRDRRRAGGRAGAG